jgi:hypothetical protein
MYSQKSTWQDISSNTPDYEEAQEEELYQPTVFLWGMKWMIVHGKKTKQVRTMRMGVTMTMNVVDHGRELRKGTTILLRWEQAATQLL